MAEGGGTPLNLIYTKFDWLFTTQLMWSVLHNLHHIQRKTKEKKDNTAEENRKITWAELQLKANE